MKLPLEHHLNIERDAPASQILIEHNRLPQAEILECFNNGAIWVEGRSKPKRLYDANRQLKAGQKLHLYCNQSTLQPCPFEPRLISDLTRFSIWFKPAGMLTQGSKWGDHWTLYRWIEQHVWPDRKCLITHRLDRFTHGLMIVAHDGDINSRFHRQFEQQQVKKTYRAIVSGLLDQADISDIDTPVEGKPALTRVRKLSEDPQTQLTLLELKPQTGRKHQIRVHLSSIGHPVLNDRLYASGPYTGDLQLQACALSFQHPDNHGPIEISLPESLLFQSASVAQSG